jgi:uncharacterized protein YrzB (UPF0473 family)
MNYELERDVFMSNNKKNDLPEEEIEIIALTDEDGKVEKFEVLDEIEYEGGDYVVLYPYSEDENDEGDGYVVILEVIEELDSDEDTYAGIDDQDLVNKIYEVFIERHKDDYNFVD